MVRWIGCAVLTLLLPPLSAHAGPPMVPPGLENVCEDIVPEPSQAALISTGLDLALQAPPLCDWEPGCMPTHAVVAATGVTAMAVVPFEPVNGGGAGGYAYAATFYDTSAVDDAASLAYVSVNGQPWLDGYAVQGPLHIDVSWTADGESLIATWQVTSAPETAGSGEVTQELAFIQGAALQSWIDTSGVALYSVDSLYCEAGDCSGLPWGFGLTFEVHFEPVE